MDFILKKDDNGYLITNDFNDSHEFTGVDFLLSKVLKSMANAFGLRVKLQGFAFKPEKPLDLKYLHSRDEVKMIYECFVKGVNGAVLSSNPILSHLSEAGLLRLDNELGYVLDKPRAYIVKKIEEFEHKNGPINLDGLFENMIVKWSFPYEKKVL